MFCNILTTEIYLCNTFIFFRLHHDFQQTHQAYAVNSALYIPRKGCQSGSQFSIMDNVMPLECQH